MPGKKLIKKAAAAAPAFINYAEMNQDALPSFDGSNERLQLLLFNTAPTVGERYFFAQDSQIDESLTTGLRVHYTDENFFGAGRPVDMWTTYNYNGVNYQVIPLDDYKRLLVTLSTNKKNYRINRCPASAFQVLPTLPGTQPTNPKARRALSVKISTMRCFIEFTAAVTVRAPFVVPVTIYYNENVRT